MLTTANYKQITTPNEEPLTAEEAKTQARIDLSDDDNYVDSLIQIARDHVERVTNFRLITQTWDFYFDDFPDDDDDHIRIPLAPLQSVTYIKYVDTNGTTQTWDSDDYVVQTGYEPGRIVLAYNEDWPTPRDQFETVTVRAVLGFGDDGADVPSYIKHAILLYVAAWYDYRALVLDQSRGNVQVLPRVVAAEALLGAERIRAV